MFRRVAGNYSWYTLTYTEQEWSFMSSSRHIIESLRRQLGQMPAWGVAASGVSSGVAGLDALMPGMGVARGAVHEILVDRPGVGSFFATILARAVEQAQASARRWVVWSDPDRELYPPALARRGIDLDRLLLLRPTSTRQALWALAECMQCDGVAATVGQVGKLTTVQARRLQLAAERGGGVGVLIRPDDARLNAQYAAATRWRVRPAPAADDGSQRWSVELVYGHGGRVNEPILLEVSREDAVLRARTDSIESPNRSPIKSADTAFADGPLSLRASQDLAHGPNAASAGARGVG
jgi:protein ImuA